MRMAAALLAVAALAGAAQAQSAERWRAFRVTPDGAMAYDAARTTPRPERPVFVTTLFWNDGPHQTGWRFAEVNQQIDCAARRIAIYEIRRFAEDGRLLGRDVPAPPPSWSELHTGGGGPPHQGLLWREVCRGEPRPPTFEAASRAELLTALRAGRHRR